MGLSVLVDFDGTVALEDTTDLILERFADPLWRSVEADWVAGRIGSRECLSRQIDLVRASAADLDRLADGVKIDPDFADFVALGRDFGLRMAIGSDGFDRIITRVLARIGVSLPVASNRLLPSGADRWRAEFPHFLDHCRSQSGNCKCALIGDSPEPGILIGDGRSDFCPATQAILVLAKKSLATYCQESRIDHIKIEGFADAALALRAFCKARDHAAPSPADETGAFHA
jgi:2-hydroxy-3-keto-5-methylthiopentenyl-1-phosphate phosphatase